MKYLMTAIHIVVAGAAMVGDTRAESNAVGATIISNRDPDKFADPKNTKYELNGTHTFDGGLFLTGFFSTAIRPSTQKPARILKDQSGTASRPIALFQYSAAQGSASTGAKTPAPPSRITFFALEPISTSVGPHLGTSCPFAIGMHLIRTTTITRRSSPPASPTNSTGKARSRRRSCAIGKMALRAVRAFRWDSSKGSDGDM
jgi:hypothetical protein